jgi:hypothetical protein
MATARPPSLAVPSPLVTRSRLLWGLALACFVVGDGATTLVGLSTPGVSEAGPVVAPLLEHLGLAALPLLKLATVGVAYAAWRFLPQPQAVGIPVGLALVGGAATAWNLVVLAGL